VFRGLCLFFFVFFIFAFFHLISSFARHLIATSSSSCSIVLYLAESWTFALWKLMAVCWRPCFIDLTIILQWCVFALGRALRSLFPILVNFWMLLAVERVGLHGPLALYEGYPNIEQACDDSKAAVQTIVLFTRSATHAHTECRAGNRTAMPNHVLLPHHAPLIFLCTYSSCLHSAD